MKAAGIVRRIGDVLAFGNPCRVRREIGEHDRAFCFKDKAIPQEIKEKYGLR